ncbi:hypothetical protein BU23DRAFT_647003 [Bimuria novae-zelandiae CBS 107.79]|uniref:Ankyrin n=1 Tax=Bimuria novae-zelandiae CBS 107.79 TaxID=1447943 RepID=A0A6A5V2J4_9PLEO|nr:hypothetical protein BU23DRAFT_647003 [Bimuria novae-zelandiae CBS 107.79]
MAPSSDVAFPQAIDYALESDYVDIVKDILHLGGHCIAILDDFVLHRWLKVAIDIGDKDLVWALLINTKVAGVAKSYTRGYEQACTQNKVEIAAILFDKFQPKLAINFTSIGFTEDASYPLMVAIKFTPPNSGGALVQKLLDLGVHPDGPKYIWYPDHHPQAPPFAIAATLGR